MHVKAESLLNRIFLHDLLAKKSFVSLQCDSRFSFNIYIICVDSGKLICARPCFSIDGLQSRLFSILLCRHAFTLLIESGIPH